MPTKIEYVHESWNPIQDKRKGKSGRGYHCTKISEGCQNCWAEIINRRFGNGLPFDDTHTEFELVPEILEKPLHWKKPRRILVQPMGDLFYEDLDFTLILDILEDVIWPTRDRHTYLILTKRPYRMKQFFENFLGWKDLYTQYPVWLGVTAENQKRFDERWSILIQILATKLFISFEPLLSDINIDPPYFIGEETLGKRSYPDWVIIGGESGAGARPMHPDWLRTIRDQCLDAEVPFFFKQWGEWIGFDDLPGDPVTIIKKLKREQIHSWSDGRCSYRIGKKAAGRILGGQEWNEIPKVSND